MVEPLRAAIETYRAMPKNTRLLVLMAIPGVALFEASGVAFLVVGALELGILLVSVGLVGAGMVGGGLWVRRRILKGSSASRESA